MERSLWQRGPGVWFNLPVAAVILAWLWAWSMPGTQFLVLLASSWALVIGAGIWLGHLIAFVTARRQGRRTSRPSRFLLAPSLSAVALALVAAGIPLQARWALSRSAFEDVVDEVMADDGASSTSERRIGLYTVRVDRRDEAVLFEVPAGGFVDGVGFAYLPDGPSTGPAGDRERSFRHLEGPWYTFTVRF